jgi:hypothetical protein
MAKNQLATEYDDAGFPLNAAFTTPIPAGAGTTTAKRAPGRLVTALVTAAGGGSTDNALIYDNTVGSGTVIGAVSGSAPAGTVVPFNMPAANGITVVNVASGPAFTLGWA